MVTLEKWLRMLFEGDKYHGNLNEPKVPPPRPPPPRNKALIRPY